MKYTLDKNDGHTVDGIKVYRLIAENGSKHGHACEDSVITDSYIEDGSTVINSCVIDTTLTKLSFIQNCKAKNTTFMEANAFDSDIKKSIIKDTSVFDSNLYRTEVYDSHLTSVQSNQDGNVDRVYTTKIVSSDITDTRINTSNIFESEIDKSFINTTRIEKSEIFECSLSRSKGTAGIVHIKESKIYFVNTSDLTCTKADLMNNSEFRALPRLGRGRRTLYVYKQKAGGIGVTTGCFVGTMKEFERKFHIKYAIWDRRVFKGYKTALRLLNHSFNIDRKKVTSNPIQCLIWSLNGLFLGGLEDNVNRFLDIQEGRI